MRARSAIAVAASESKTNVKTTVKTHITARNAYADTASAGSFVCAHLWRDVVLVFGTMPTLQIDVEGGSGSSG